MSPCPACGAEARKEEYCPDCLRELGIKEDTAERLDLVETIEKDGAPEAGGEQSPSG